MTNNFYAEFRHLEHNNTLIFRDKDEYLQWRNDPITNLCDWFLEKYADRTKESD